MTRRRDAARAAAAGPPEREPRRRGAVAAGAPGGPGARSSTAEAARLVAIPTVTLGRLRSARLIAAGTVLRIILTPVIMALVIAAAPTAAQTALAAVLFVHRRGDGLGRRPPRAPLGRHHEARLVPRHDGGQAARLRRADRAASRSIARRRGSSRSSSDASS